MKKKLFFAAIAIMTMASCSDNDYVGDKAALSAGAGDGAISFNLNVPSITRSDKTGSDAATDLNEQFYVYAIKKESADGAGNVQSGNLVFNNYVVKWANNTAYTTTSNTKNWEYVGYTLSAKEQANVTANSGAVAQTIKYWDFGADDYTYYAFSALPADIEGDKVQVSKVQTATSGFYDNGYTVTLAAGADLDKLYFAERRPITKSANTDRTQANQYGGNVTFRFHNMASKVRVAMYETVPGYTVTIKEFKVTDAADPEFSAMTTSETANFAANLQNCAKGTAGTMTVKYIADEGATKNHPTISFTGTAANVLELGEGLKENVTIGDNATNATFDRADGADADSKPDYTSVFPNETNTQNLKLKVSYTLTAPVTGETILVSDKTAEVPAKYLQWKPGYAYTYIFKITDDNLYPITFDALEVVDEDGLAEYITTVTEPSITTFGVSGGKYVTESNEYTSGSDIYATIMDGSNVIDPTLGTNVNVYLATTTDATNFPITEASVAESLAEIAGAKKITTVLKNSDGTTSFTAAPVKVTTVPGEDGKTKAINALKLTGAKATTATTALVVEYIKTAATYHTSSSAYTFADEAAFNTEISTNGKLYTDAGTTTELTWSVYNTDESSKTASYYRRTAVKTVGSYAYKVIHVVAAP